MKRPSRLYGLAAALALICLCPGTAQAYLDPGTGSMLVSALAGIAAAAFFMLKSFWRRAAGLFYRLAGRLTGSGREAVPTRADAGIVFYSEGRQYWNTFKPVLQALDAAGEKALYLAGGPDDPGLSHPFTHVRARHIGTGSRAFAHLAMLEVDLCVLTTPGLDVLQIRRSPGVGHYAHLVHSVTDMALYKLFSFDWFDSVLCSGPHQMRSLRALETLRGTPEKLLLETGCPYMDALAEELEAIPEGDARRDGAARILVAPTWGANGLLRRFGLDLLLPLAEAGFALTIRPHPQSYISEAAMLENLAAALAPFPSVRWDAEAGPLPAMLASSLLISDLSGIVFDYAFILERPVVTVRMQVDTRGLEAGDLPYPAWELDLLPELGARIEPEEVRDLPRVIANLPKREDFAVRARALREKSVFNFRRSGEVAARQLLDIRKNLHEN